MHCTIMGMSENRCVISPLTVLRQTDSQAKQVLYLKQPVLTSMNQIRCKRDRWILGVLHVWFFFGGGGPSAGAGLTPTFV